MDSLLSSYWVTYLYQRGNRGSQVVRAESARIGARGIRADSADLAADRGNAAEVRFAVPKLIKLFVVKFI